MPAGRVKASAAHADSSYQPVPMRQPFLAQRPGQWCDRGQEGGGEGVVGGQRGAWEGAEVEGGAGSAELVVWQGGEELVVWHRPRDTVEGRRERAVDSWTRTGARSAGQDSKIYAAPVGPSIFTQLVPERAYARRYAATADRQIRFCVVDVL